MQTLDAADRGVLSVVVAALEGGVNPLEARDELGRTPLHLAAAKGFLPVVEVLVDRVPALLTAADNVRACVHVRVSLCLCLSVRLSLSQELACCSRVVPLRRQQHTCPHWWSFSLRLGLCRRPSGGPPLCARRTLLDRKTDGDCSNCRDYGDIWYVCLFFVFTGFGVPRIL